MNSTTTCSLSPGARPPADVQVCDTCRSRAIQKQRGSMCTQRLSGGFLLQARHRQGPALALMQAGCARTLNSGLGGGTTWTLTH